MTQGPIPRGIEAVREFVRQALSGRENLVAGSFALGESPLVRNGQLCGYYFWLEGPRSVRLSAVWGFEAGTLLLYGADGSRFQTHPAPELKPQTLAMQRSLAAASEKSQRQAA